MVVSQCRRMTMMSAPASSLITRTRNLHFVIFSKTKQLPLSVPTWCQMGTRTAIMSSSASGAPKAERRSETGPRARTRAGACERPAVRQDKHAHCTPAGPPAPRHSVPGTEAGARPIRRPRPRNPRPSPRRSDLVAVLRRRLAGDQRRVTPRRADGTLRAVGRRLSAAEPFEREAIPSSALKPRPGAAAAQRGPRPSSPSPASTNTCRCRREGNPRGLRRRGCIGVEAQRVLLTSWLQGGSTWAPCAPGIILRTEYSLAPLPPPSKTCKTHFSLCSFHSRPAVAQKVCHARTAASAHPPLAQRHGKHQRVTDFKGRVARACDASCNSLDSLRCVCRFGSPAAGGTQSAPQICKPPPSLSLTDSC